MARRGGVLEMLLTIFFWYVLCFLASHWGIALKLLIWDMAFGCVCRKHFLYRNAAIGTEAERL